MTNDEFFDMVQKRYDRGLSFKRPNGRDTQWESFQYALELHRLMPYAADVTPQYVLRLIQEKTTGGRRTKYQVSQDLAFYDRLSKMFEGKTWPRPTIPNTKHDCIRMHLQTLQGEMNKRHMKSANVTSHSSKTVRRVRISGKVFTYQRQRISDVEQWKPIPGYEGLYEVSNHGNVRSNYKDRVSVKKQRLNDFGYCIVTLNGKDGKRKIAKVHRLVAMAFIPNPDHLSDVNHINGIKTENHVGNLEWLSHRQNVKHAYDTGIHQAHQWTENEKAMISQRLKGNRNRKSESAQSE